MGKQNSVGKGAAGLAEWLPLLGSICHALASMNEELADEEDKRRPADGLVPERLNERRKAG